MSMVQDTPFEPWIRRHAIYKILAKDYYEDLLQTAIMLVYASQHSGLVINPDIPKYVLHWVMQSVTRYYTYGNVFLYDP